MVYADPTYRIGPPAHRAGRRGLIIRKRRKALQTREANKIPKALPGSCAVPDSATRDRQPKTRPRADLHGRQHKGDGADRAFALGPPDHYEHLNREHDPVIA